MQSLAFQHLAKARNQTRQDLKGNIQQEAWTQPPALYFIFLPIIMRITSEIIFTTTMALWNELPNPFPPVLSH